MKGTVAIENIIQMKATSHGLVIDVVVHAKLDRQQKFPL